MLRPSDNALVFCERVLGVRPHEHQAAFLLDAHPLRVVIAGRQSGKSTGNACDVAFRAVRAAVQDQPFRALLTAPTTAQAKITFDIVERLLRGSPVGGLITRVVTSPFPLLELGSNVSVTARPASAVYLRGFSYSCAYADECAFIGDAIILEVIMPLLAREGAPLTCSSTPSVRGSWLHQTFERGQQGDDPHVRSFTFPSSANVHLDRSFVERQRSELSREQWETEWEGRWSEPIDACFRWSDVLAAATAEPGERGGTRFVAGFDPAQSRDRSALVILDVTTMPRRVAHIEDLAGRAYGEQVDRVAAITRSFRVSRIAVDATGVGAAVADLMSGAGIHGVERVVFSAPRKIELVTGLVAAVEKREVVFPPDPALLSELRWLRVTRAPSGLPRYQAAPGARDDFACALALALWAGGGPAPRQHPAHEGLPPFLRTSDRWSGSALVAEPGGLPDIWDDLR